MHSAQFVAQFGLCVQRAATSRRNAVQIILPAPKSGTDSAVLYTQDNAMLISKCCSLCTTQQCRTVCVVDSADHAVEYHDYRVAKKCYRQIYSFCTSWASQDQIEVGESDGGQIRRVIRSLLKRNRNICLEMCFFGPLTSFYARTETWAGFDALE